MKNLTVNCKQICTYIFCLIFFNLHGQKNVSTFKHSHKDHAIHYCDLVEDDESYGPTTLSDKHLITVKSMVSAAPAPKVNIKIDQFENGSILMHNVGGWNQSSSPKAQLSLNIQVQNLESTLYLHWKTVSFLYTINGQNFRKDFSTGTLPIAPNSTASWQNKRDYHQEGDVIYLDYPFPNLLTILFYFEGFEYPVISINQLSTYDHAFKMPFQAFDLKENEVWEGGSTHGGGTQVFGYDLAVYGYENGWSHLYPGKDGTKNSDYRVWGKPIYAMEDGIILEFNDTVPSNIPNYKIDFSSYGVRPGGGNHFYIQHNDVVALYAHFQLGSLNPKLKIVGAQVKKGDFLGLAGNSGNSTGPHLHISLRQGNSPEEGPFRPLKFNHGYVIEKESFASPNSNAPWYSLNYEGIPGRQNTRAFIWPGTYKPKYNANIYAGAWRGKTSQANISVENSAIVFMSIDQINKNLGLRLTDLNVLNANGNILYSGVWNNNYGTNNTYIQLGTDLFTFNSEYLNKSANGYYIKDLEIFKDASNNVKYAALYMQGPTKTKIALGQNWTDFNTTHKDLYAQGYQLNDIEIYVTANGQTLYAGIWRKGGTGENPIISASTWTAFTSIYNIWKNKGYNLLDFDTEAKANGITEYVGVFVESSQQNTIYESHWNAFYDKWEYLKDTGDFNLIDLNIYSRDIAPFNLISNDKVSNELNSRSSSHLKLKIFPNPCTDRILIESATTFNTYSIMNINGTILKSEKLNSNTLITSIELNNFSTGTYYISIPTLNGNIIEPFQISK